MVGIGTFRSALWAGLFAAFRVAGFLGARARDLLLLAGFLAFWEATFLVRFVVERAAFFDFDFLAIGVTS